MTGNSSRIGAVAGGILILWIVTAVLLSQVIPGPHAKLDYLVIGAVATFVSMLVLFVVLLQGWVKTDAVFYKRRTVAPEKPAEKPPEAEG